jgi:Ca-activated chloride channel family protein
MEDLTLYDRLCIPRDASQEEIRRAYRQLVLHLHPDTNVNKGDTQLFLDIQQAYESLSDPLKREDYDRQLPAESTVDSPITIKTSYSQPLIARLPEPQLVYALLDLTLTADTNEWVISTPLNISLVVDCSTSMQGVRLDAVKMTVIDCLRKLQPSDIFSLVKFNDFADLLIPAVNQADIKSAEMKVQLLRAEGGTEIYKGLEMGFTQINQNYSSQRINHIILVTDGRTYGDETQCQQLAEQCAALRIGISALGIGNEWNDRFLDQITAKTGGICKYIPDSGDIRNTILDEISRLGSCLTEQINFNINTPQHIELSSIYRLQPDASPLEPHSPINLGNLPHFGNMNVLFEFTVKDIPPGTTDLTLSKGFIYYEIPRHTRKTRYVNRLAFSRPVSTEPVKSLPPTSILNAITFLSLYHMQERASFEMNKGNHTSAARYMENMATQLLQKGERNLAQSVLTEATNLRNNQSFSEDGEKRIKYGTRALLLPPGSKPNKL